jgi:ABC-type uncharacterized transport system fused permease/ATPase subunit
VSPRILLLHRQDRHHLSSAVRKGMAFARFDKSTDARAMLRRRPHLLVLDEATSAIDVEGEQAILERLLQASPRPTIVMIAHRLESLRNCQRILRFLMLPGWRKKHSAAERCYIIKAEST